MKIVYMGTPDFAVPALETLVCKHQVVAVYTQPDRPAGRGHKLAQSPVKVAALAHGIPVFQPQSLRLPHAKQARAQLKAHGADIFVVAAYGLILGKGILNMPPLGCINIHASLLPKYRGASPIHAALLNGDTRAGISIMHMDVGIDTGDVILMRELDVPPHQRFEELHNRMAALGATAVVEALQQLEYGTATRTPQNHEEQSYAPVLKKSDAIINWSQTSAQLINKTRALDPWPGSQTTYDGAVLKIWQLEPATYQGSQLPGTVLEVDPRRGVLIKTGDQAVWATNLQGNSSKRMPATDYLRGRTIQIGAVLGG